MQGALPQSEYKDQVKQKRRRSQQFFVHWDKEDQLKAFFAWLPKELHQAPGIDWTRLPAEAMGYCVKTIGDSPDAAVLALALASADEGLATNTLYEKLKALNVLFRTLRSDCKMNHISELRHPQIWQNWIATKNTVGTARCYLLAYSSFATGHIPRYLMRLDTTDRLHMKQYELPPLPPDLLKKHFPHNRVKRDQQAKRKEQSDVLTPLYPVLRQIVRFRKQLAERTLVAIHQARRQVESGEAKLPYHFSHTDALPEVNRDARTISEVQIVGREVTMKFILWDKCTWVSEHKERFSSDTQREADMQKGRYSPEQNCFFVQSDGPASDLLWFGDLVEHRLFQHFDARFATDEKYRERLEMARRLGFSCGCVCKRSGLLTSGERWFSDVGHQNGDFVFEPEALYRGVIFGATLAMIALSNGSRMTELQQVSCNKERRVTRTETIVLLGEDGQPCRDADGKLLTKQAKLHFQHLLPKGSKTEEERQLFPLSKECMRLLGEMKALLEAAHGEVPVVLPSRSNSKYHDLKPERYIFQWDATSDDQQGSIGAEDISTLLRFILHGLELFTSQGKPIRVSTHLLRHVMTNHARQYRHVPPEIIAHFFLHHRLQELTGRAPSLSEVSEYYFMMTEEQRFAIVRADLDEQEELDRMLLRAVPTQRDLETKNADLQTVYDVWHALHPTTLGNCGCPGLCPRERDRALCLGCSYLVEDPEKLGVALVWRASYAQQAALFESQGNLIDARQARIKVQLLDDVIAVMRMQLQKEAEGSYIPLYKVLLSPKRQAEELHEGEE